MVTCRRDERTGIGRGDERGFTLVELLITLVVGPIVIGGLVLMLLLVFNVQNGVANKISGSVNAQVTTSNLQSDVQNATYVTTAPTPGCGSTGTQILGTESQGNTVIVSYDRVAKGKKYSLIRYGCTSANTSVPTSVTILSDDIPSTQAVLITPSAVATSASTTWAAATGVSAVSINVTEPDTKVSYSLTSTPRAWIPVASASGGSPVPEITVLGTNTSDCSSPALSLSNNAGIQYGNGFQSVVWGSSCTQTSVQSSSSWNNQTSSYSNWDNQWGGSSSSSSSGSTSDPLGGLTAPTYTTPSGNGSCSGGSCSSGNYSSPQTITGTDNFGNGTYVFTQPVVINGGSVTFGSGTYVFQGGLTIEGSSNVNLGTGTFICNGSTKTSNAITVTGTSKCQSGSGGSLIYVGTGCANFSSTGTVSLCGKSSNQGVAVWDNCSNSTSSPCVNLGGCGSSSGSSSSPCSYGGVYCPNGSVSCSNGKCGSSFVDCGSLQVQSGSTLCVG
jgi:prepilin-type N-terminal cleavage/methylation domain-containing protein